MLQPSKMPQPTCRITTDSCLSSVSKPWLISPRQFKATNRRPQHTAFSVNTYAAEQHCVQPRIRGQAVASPEKQLAAANIKPAGHSSLLHSLGDVGDVHPTHLPWLLRLSHVQAKAGGDSAQALQESARGLMVWRATLDRALLPDDEAIKQLMAEGEQFAANHNVQQLQWPQEPLRTMLIKALAKLDVARFARKYPGVKDALLKSLLETVVRYQKTIMGQQDEDDQPEHDPTGAVYKTAAELAKQEAAQRAARAGKSSASMAGFSTDEEAPRRTLDTAMPLDKRTALELVKELYFKWQLPMDALTKAGKAFEGLEALLGGAAFDLQSNMWRRKGWGEMDELRKKLENMKELRAVVRSLGRGTGWGPLRRAPVQFLDFNGRPGLLRTVLEAQETRGLTRSDDISRLLPAEAALLARGRTVRQSKLLFFARLAEKALQTYERDGWGEFPTNIKIDRREIRPTADMGPILLCVDTSGSMRGPREVVAKALALECMRAAREQERGCYVFAFSGPQEVQELELNMDIKSVNNLMDFLEKVFNGGSDFNEPVKRCLDRLTDAKWANSDIMLVSDGELRQPGPEIMRKLAGAKEKLGLRVHGLIVGSPEKKRADPAVLRSLCTNYLPNGKVEVLIDEFSNWASVQADETLKFDWDDTEANTRRRLAGLALEKRRQEEMKRKKREMVAAGEKPASNLGTGRKKH